MKIITNNTECGELELNDSSSMKDDLTKLCFQQIDTKRRLHKIHLFSLITL